MSIHLLFVIFGALLLIYIWRTIDPKLDNNYETGDLLLWYNDPFDKCERKAIKLWKIN